MKTLPLVVILLAILFQGGAAQEKNLSPAVSSLVEAEREFAATSLKEGIRASFLKYFADDGISLSPKPHIYRESALKTPPPKDPLARTLYWEPIVADVSSSGDLGYTMGPASLKDSAKQDAPAWYGFYFSIWKKQKDGTWRVAVDAGTTSTNVVEQYFGREVTPAVHASFRSRGKAAGGKGAIRELLKCDRNFSKSPAAGDVKNAYQKALDPEARALREGLVPLTGKEAILAYLVRGTALRSLEPALADVSGAGDMGYTYGAYREGKKTKDPSGYYARVWRRDAGGKWMLVVETAVPAK